MAIKHQDSYKNDNPASNTVFSSPILNNNPAQYIKVPDGKTCGICICIHMHICIDKCVLTYSYPHTTTTERPAPVFLCFRNNCTVV